MLSLTIYRQKYMSIFLRRFFALFCAFLRFFALFCAFLRFFKKSAPKTE